MTRFKPGREGTDPKPGKDEHHRRDAGVRTGLGGWDDLRNSLGLTQWGRRRAYALVATQRGISGDVRTESVRGGGHIRVSTGCGRSRHGGHGQAYGHRGRGG